MKEEGQLGGRGDGGVVEEVEEDDKGEKGEVDG